jgi:hypothetical protein
MSQELQRKGIAAYYAMIHAVGRGRERGQSTFIGDATSRNRTIKAFDRSSGDGEDGVRRNQLRCGGGYGAAVIAGAEMAGDAAATR